MRLKQKLKVGQIKINKNYDRLEVIEIQKVGYNHSRISFYRYIDEELVCIPWYKKINTAALREMNNLEIHPAAVKIKQLLQLEKMK